jgi:hypothetical protein
MWSRKVRGEPDAEIDDMIGSKRRGRAVELLGLALEIVKAQGTWKPIAGTKSRFLSYDVEGLNIAYRTPFQKLPEPAEHISYLAARHGLEARAKDNGITTTSLPDGL